MGGGMTHLASFRLSSVGHHLVGCKASVANIFCDPCIQADSSRGQRQRQRRGEDVVHPLKDHILEMVYPTYVKHVAQVGWDGPSGNAPSWVCRSKHECDMNIIAVCKKILFQLHRLQSTLDITTNS
ncbi:uncharacterized protein LOC120010919 isoform X3 [Tripterygium wilfordii]|uniref:uncharacterized protein LOC120010919 isoform X3 n=1 Tax=Tripterygium wilfordii TaxID=458696 RepID=UPI0018F83130|nr:uncharacterized protein LOC120010919 isoform X3 [Tripterygium wilfordii]